MKTSKRIISFVLCALMVASCFFCTGKLPELEAKAATVGEFTQTRVVDQNLYKSYQKKFFLGEETNWPTDFVLPGLSSNQDYTPQGMTYWAEKEWILISAYDAGGSDHSVIYALDVVSTDLVAVFKILNADGSVNKSHGGGIAASEHNFYYADSGSKISYIPLEEMKVAPGTVKEIRLRGSIDCAGELGTAYTSYCCYEDGVLWAGNFYLKNDNYDYGQSAHSTSDSMIVGYKLRGNSSEEEWNNLQDCNIIEPYGNYGSNLPGATGVMKFSSSLDDRGFFDVSGNVTASNAGEDYATFGLAYLEKGVKYKLEFDVSADALPFNFYFIKPGYTSINEMSYINSSNTQWKENLNANGQHDGTYHVIHTFTPGVATPGAYTEWQNKTDVTGNYEIRFDQDNTANAHNFSIQNIRIVKVTDGYNDGFTEDSMSGYDCAGNPSYVVTIPGVDKIQYAMVSKGKMYISRSWSRTEGSTHTRELMIADIDLGSPGSANNTINGRTRPCHVLNSSATTRFGGNKNDSSHDLTKMFYMGEALCVIDDYLYMFGEGAAWNYNGKDSSSVCPEPIDVIWKIDQYAIQGLTRPHEDVTAVEYERVYSLSDINSTDEYIILRESPLKDPVTQDNILYLLDSFGGYGDKKLPKKTNPNSTDITAASTGDSRGIVGYEIRDYSVKVDPQTGKESLILNAEDDANKSLHWQFNVGTITTSGSEKTAAVNIKNRDLYYAKHPYLYVGDTLFATTTNASSTMTIKDWGYSIFTIYGNGTDYSIWCNDGSVPESIDKYTKFYATHGQTNFVPNYHGLEEVAGTFHITNGGQPALPTGEQQGMQIYKRVSNPYTSSYETQVYTDLSAKLTADGTYDITLETYATNNLQYQRVNERPTDFIFVLDNSGTLDKPDTNAYRTDPSWTPIKIEQIVTSGNTDKGSNVIDNRSGSDKFYYQTPDGAYHPIYASVNTSGNYNQCYWAYYINIYDGLRYLLKPDGSVSSTGWTYDEFITNYNNRTNYSASNSNSYNSNRKETKVVGGTYYTYSAGHMRLDGIKNAVDSLTYKIAEEAGKSGLDHRIALVTFGSDDKIDSRYVWTGTNLYTNNGSKISYPNITDANYQSAFFSVNQFGTVRSLVAGMEPKGHTFPSYGLNMASKIIDQQKNLGNTYDVNGNRSAVVIVISDGTPGGDESAYYNVETAKSVANDTLANGAYNLKRNGAYIYSVLLGNETVYNESQFDKRDFMKYLSSEYTGSKSLTDPGPHNTKEGVDYYKQIAHGSNFDLYDITDEVFNEVVANSNNAIASLTDKAILREHLTDAFDTSNATIKYETAESYYDGIGRLNFRDPVTASGITGTLTDDNEISITGFDYSANNVSEYNSKGDNSKGKKLIVTISGVIADRNQELLNTSINDTSKTALYQNQTFVNSNQPVKSFPTYHFSIPEYTYVMDYDLPMLDTDINGTLVSVDTAPDKQSTYVTNLQTEVFGVQFIDGNQNMLYSLNSQDGSAEDNSRAYVLIKRDDGTYDWFRLNLLPASTVYYEENKTATLSSTSSYADWTQVGSFTNKVQDPYGNEIFGNDPLYTNFTDTHSLGTYLHTTVTESNNRSETKTFSFTGTGFDLISACAPNTGIQTVVVKDAATGAYEKIYIVDTYYNDSAYGTIYQAPIVHFEGTYKEYIVETTAAYYSFAGALQTQSVSTNALGETGVDAYTAPAETTVTDEFFAAIGMDELIGQNVDLVWMDENSVLNGGEGAVETTVSTQAGETVTTSTPATSLINYIDGFRIYNPLEGQYSDAYYPENEKNSSYFNLMSCIGSGAIEGTGLFAYIEGSSGNFSFADYTGLKGKGPTNEVYLTKNDNGLSFKISVSDINNVSAKLSMRAIKGQPTVKINNKSIALKSTSEQYYDITEAIKSASGGVVTINVSGGNAGDLVAIGNLRLNNATLVNLANDDLENVARMMTMAATPLSHDPFTAYSPAPTFSQAPADDPNIDPIGKIPSLEEYIAQNGIKVPDDHSGADRFADKLVAIIDKIIEFIKKAIVLVANAVTSIF